MRNKELCNSCQYYKANYCLYPEACSFDKNCKYYVSALDIIWWLFCGIVMAAYFIIIMFGAQIKSFCI